MNHKGFRDHKDFYKSIYDKIRAMNTDIHLSTPYAFQTEFDASSKFLKKFYRKNEKNYFLNHILYIIAIAKAHHFAMKNLLFVLEKVDLDCHDVLQKLDKTFSDNFNKFTARIQSMSVYINEICYLYDIYRGILSCK